MKKFVAALLVLTMVLALATTAMAACKIKANTWVITTKDTNAYSAAKSSKKLASVARKGSYGPCVKVCGKFAKVCVNTAGKTYAWFKVCDLEEYTERDQALFVWAKGGKGMSTCQKGTIRYYSFLKSRIFKVTGHTNLRKNCGMKFKSQGVVEKCTKLKCTGRVGLDDRTVFWFEVCYKGKKLWVSSYYINYEEVLTPEELVEIALGWLV